MGVFCEHELTPQLAALLKRNHEQAARLSQMRRDRPELWRQVQFRLKVLWTADSNAMEGSTLTFAETLFFLQEGLTVEGKPLKDFLDARNHAEAIDFLMQVVKDERPISTSLMKEINALIMKGVEGAPARDTLGRRVNRPATPGEYKRLPNHVLQQDGAIHEYAAPEQVASEMEALIDWINRRRGQLDPIIIAAIVHYNFVRIHPFDDGNGRGARLLMNLILLQAGLVPAVFRKERRRDYIAAVQAADGGDLQPFILFASQASLETAQSVVNDLKQGSHEN